MAYVLVETKFVRDPKLADLARRLDIPVTHAVGLLACLWAYVQDYRPDGNLGAANPDNLAVGAGWDGDPQLFVTALKDCRGLGGTHGFLDEVDGNLILHDWDDWTGRAAVKRAETRQSDAERQRRHRERIAADPVTPVTRDVTRDSHTVSHGVTPLIQYKPIQTNPIQPKEKGDVTRDACDIPALDLSDPFDALETWQRDFANSVMVPFQNMRIYGSDPVFREEVAAVARDCVPRAEDLAQANSVLMSFGRAVKPWPKDIRALLIPESEGRNGRSTNRTAGRPAQGARPPGRADPLSARRRVDV